MISLTGMRSAAKRVWVKVLVEAKMLLQRLGVPRRADLFFDCVWDWRYPPYLYLSLSPGHIIECSRANLPFVLTYGTVRQFFFRTRGVEPDGVPSAHTIVSTRQTVPQRFERRIRISYDDRPSDIESTALVMPYFCHPDFYRLGLHEEAQALRQSARTTRVLFAGTEGEDTYEQRFGFPILTRTKVLQTVMTELADQVEVVRARAALEKLQRDGAAKGIVLALSNNTGDGTDKHLIRPREYVRLLATSDFFLAPPGWVMPLCHNIVESMAAGAIPITNYGAYLSPPLVHDHNCIAFDTPATLVEQLRRVLAMPHEEIQALRSGVIAYYDEYLSPPSFRARLDATRGADVEVRVNVEPGRPGARFALDEGD